MSVETLKKEISRCKKLIDAYRKVGDGVFWVEMISSGIKTAETAIRKSDTVTMKSVLKELQGYD